jgi:hypothetical protein
MSRSSRPGGRRWNQSWIPSLSLLECPSLDLSLTDSTEFSFLELGTLPQFLNSFIHLSQLACLHQSRIIFVRSKYHRIAKLEQFLDEMTNELEQTMALVRILLQPLDPVTQANETLADIKPYPALRRMNLSDESYETSSQVRRRSSTNSASTSRGSRPHVLTRSEERSARSSIRFALDFSQLDPENSELPVRYDAHSHRLRTFPDDRGR